MRAVGAGISFLTAGAALCLLCFFGDGVVLGWKIPIVDLMHGETVDAPDNWALAVQFALCAIALAASAGSVLLIVGWRACWAARGRFEEMES